MLEQRDGKLNIASLAAVSAAQKIGGSVTGFVAGKGTKAVAEEAAKVKGLDKVIFVDNDAYTRVLYTAWWDYIRRANGHRRDSQRASHQCSLKMSRRAASHTSSPVTPRTARRLCLG